ncbi:MAG TPA: glycine zipper 2TM domain-containing protein [Sphingomicrobium sp.]|nr:glycine zipper 2TM domain-containing protein [Sphingomicrobium sp.]
MRKTIMAVTAAALAVPTIPATPALAHDGYYHGKIWKDSRGRYRCKRPNGTTGLIIGAAGGALLGRAIDTKGERATGTIIGAAAGALIGRKIDRSRVKCR